jgi:hypothetical protein
VLLLEKIGQEHGLIPKPLIRDEFKITAPSVDDRIHAEVQIIRGEKKLPGRVLDINNNIATIELTGIQPLRCMDVKLGDAVFL